MIIFSMDELETMHERKGNGTSKEEEFNATTLRRNKIRGKKNVTFSLRFHFLQKSIHRVSKCIIIHFLVHFQVKISPSHIAIS